MNRVRAVVVDDNRLNREVVSRTLEARGLEVAQAEDAMAGWKAIQNNSPQLAVIDVMMPGEIDGVGLCRIIRTDNNTKHMVVVMITAADRKRETERAAAAGADILIPKPFSPREFWMQVEPLLKIKDDKAGEYRVFILDDDENDCKLAHKALSSQGFQVSYQTEVSGAVWSIKQTRPHLVLLDVMMPGLSGDELALIIEKDKSIASKPRIVFYSNKDARELESLTADKGADGFVCKVDGPDALIAEVRRVILSAG